MLVQLRPNPNLRPKPKMSRSVSHSAADHGRRATSAPVTTPATTPATAAVRSDVATSPPSGGPATASATTPSHDATPAPGGDIEPRPATRRRKSSDHTAGAGRTPPRHPRRPSRASSAADEHAGAYRASPHALRPHHPIALSAQAMIGWQPAESLPTAALPVNVRAPGTRCRLVLLLTRALLPSSPGQA